MKKIVDKLITRKETIATMESCTGGGIANAITNIPGASEIIKFSAVTYSNEYKIKMGVNASTIDTYSVYSKEVACEMSKEISLFANSTYGVGVTGKIDREDPNNLRGDVNTIFVSIYNSNLDNYITKKIELPLLSRNECKEIIIEAIKKLLLSILE